LPKYKLLIVSLSSPLLVGVYKDDFLIDSTSSEGKTSDVLLGIVASYLKKYDISETIYTNGPGSFMAIKLTYVMLRTIEILTGVRCSGCSGFNFNGEKPIKAIGDLCFIKEKETIMMKKYTQSAVSHFSLPKSIQDLNVDEESAPSYVLPAV